MGEELWAASNLVGPCSLTRGVHWLGGHGVLIVTASATFTGSSAKIVFNGFSSSLGPIDELSPGVVDINASGAYYFNLPEGDMSFSIILDEGDIVQFSRVSILGI